MDRVRKKYVFGSFELDPDERVLWREGEPVPLPPKLIDTLIVLVENAGHIVDKNEIIDRVWPDSFVEDGSLTKNISVLRKMLGDGSGHGFIENVPRRGYRFNGPVVTPEIDGEIVVTRRARVRIVTGDQEEAERIVAEIGMSGMARRIQSLRAATRSLAVLPLRPLGTDLQDEFLAIGIADALITRLSNLHEVIVRPTSAVVNYASPEKDSVQAGRELRVESVLEGTFQKIGETLRVTVQLVSVEDEAPFWAGKFDVRFTDVFEVEDSISEQVVQALSLGLTRDEQLVLTKRYTTNTEAYQAYLKGRYFWNARSGEWMQKALAQFQQAISLDPDFALAHTGLADCYNTLGFWGYAVPGDVFPRAKVLAARALELDDQLAEAHAAFAWALLNYDWDFVASEKEFKRAIELNPGYSLARLWYAMGLALNKRFEEAFEEINRAHNIDPLSLIINTDIGILLFLTRRYDEAIEQFNKTLELGPGYLLAVDFLGYTYGLKGMFVESLDCYSKNVELTGGAPFSYASLGFGKAMAGCSAEAMEFAKRSKQLNGDGYFSPHYWAQLYAQLGDRDQAFEWLERAVEERSPWITWLRVNPSYDDLRTDPRFEEILIRCGLK